jgi:hypothetical protein
MSSSRTPVATPVVLCVRPDATIEGLHQDALNLEDLGDLEVKRASAVEFDPTRRQWVVEDAATGKELFAHAKRDVCIQWEVEHFSALFLAGHRPFAADPGGDFTP